MAQKLLKGTDIIETNIQQTLKIILKYNHRLQVRFPSPAPKSACSQNKRTAPISTVRTNWGSSNLIIGFVYIFHQKPFTVKTITSVADLSSRSSVIIVMMLPSESNAELQNQG